MNIKTVEKFYKSVILPILTSKHIPEKEKKKLIRQSIDLQAKIYNLSNIQKFRFLYLCERLDVDRPGDTILEEMVIKSLDKIIDDNVTYMGTYDNLFIYDLDANKLSIMNICIAHNFINLLKKILSKDDIFVPKDKKFSNRPFTSYDDYPIIIAIKYKSIKSLKILLENGADPNIGRYSPIIAASKNNNMPAIDLLLHNGAELNIQDNKNDNLLIKYALDHCGYQVQEFLIQKCKDANIKIFSSKDSIKVYITNALNGYDNQRAQRIYIISSILECVNYLTIDDILEIWSKYNKNNISSGSILIAKYLLLTKIDYTKITDRDWELINNFIESDCYNMWEKQKLLFINLLRMVIVKSRLSGNNRNIRYVVTNGTEGHCLGFLKKAELDSYYSFIPIRKEFNAALAQAKYLFNDLGIKENESLYNSALPINLIDLACCRHDSKLTLPGFPNEDISVEDIRNFLRFTEFYSKPEGKFLAPEINFNIASYCFGKSNQLISFMLYYFVPSLKAMYNKHKNDKYYTNRIFKVLAVAYDCYDSNKKSTYVDKLKHDIDECDKKLNMSI